MTVHSQVHSAALGCRKRPNGTESLTVRRNRNSPYYWLPLLAILLILSVSGLGYIPVPGAGGAITIMHIPVILAGILSGPMAGMLLGAVFGLTNFYFVPPHDFASQVLPRLLIGLISSLSYWSAKHYATREAKVTAGAAVATIAGTLTNSLGVTLTASAKGIFNLNDMLLVAAMHGCIELFLALLIVLPVTVSIHHWRTQS